MNILDAFVLTAGVSPPTTPRPTTNLRVVDVTQNSVRLGWLLLPGATGYILRWREERGGTQHLEMIQCFIRRYKASSSVCNFL